MEKQKHTFYFSLLFGNTSSSNIVACTENIKFCDKII